MSLCLSTSFLRQNCLPDSWSQHENEALFYPRFVMPSNIDPACCLPRRVFYLLLCAWRQSNKSLLNNKQWEPTNSKTCRLTGIIPSLEQTGQQALPINPLLPTPPHTPIEDSRLLELLLLGEIAFRNLTATLNIKYGPRAMKELQPKQPCLSKAEVRRWMHIDSKGMGME